MIPDINIMDKNLNERMYADHKYFEIYLKNGRKKKKSEQKYSAS